jgi:hypothetical protein
MIIMARRLPPHVRVAIEAVRAGGHEALITNGGRHYKLHWTDRNGRHSIPISRSPSSWNVEAMVVCDVRRALRQAEGA